MKTRFMRFLDRHPYFTVLLLAFLGADALYFLEQIFLDDVPVADASGDFLFAIVASVVALYLVTKAFGVWRVDRLGQHDHGDD